MMHAQTAPEPVAPPVPPAPPPPPPPPREYDGPDIQLPPMEEPVPAI